MTKDKEGHSVVALFRAILREPKHAGIAIAVVVGILLFLHPYLGDVLPKPASASEMHPPPGPAPAALQPAIGTRDVFQIVGAVILSACALLALYYVARTQKPNNNSSLEELLKELKDGLNTRSRLARLASKSSDNVGKGDLSEALELIANMGVNKMTHNGADAKATAWVKVAVYDSGRRHFKVVYYTEKTSEVERNYEVLPGEGGIGTCVVDSISELSRGNIPRTRYCDRDELKTLSAKRHKANFDGTQIDDELLIPMCAFQRDERGDWVLARHGAGGQLHYCLIGIMCICTNNRQYSHLNQPETIEHLRRYANLTGRIIANLHDCFPVPPSQQESVHD